MNDEPGHTPEDADPGVEPDAPEPTDRRDDSPFREPGLQDIQEKDDGPDVRT